MSEIEERSGILKILWCGLTDWSPKDRLQLLAVLQIESTDRGDNSPSRASRANDTPDQVPQYNDGLRASRSIESVDYEQASTAAAPILQHIHYVVVQA